VILLQFPLSSLSDLRLVIAYGLELQEEERKRSMMMIFVENLWERTKLKRTSLNFYASVLVFQKFILILRVWWWMWWNWYETENFCGGFDSVVAVLDSVTVVMEFCYGGDWREKFC
jgi:hypothetical protein